MQVDVPLRQRSKFLSDQQPEANVGTPQTTKICNPWIPLVSYNTIKYNTSEYRKIVMIPLIQNDNILVIDIIALQEAWRNTQDQTNYHP